MTTTEAEVMEVMVEVIMEVMVEVMMMITMVAEAEVMEVAASIKHQPALKQQVVVVAMVDPSTEPALMLEPAA